jgi:hypothetical protein
VRDIRKYRSAKSPWALTPELANFRLKLLLGQSHLVLNAISLFGSTLYSRLPVYTKDRHELVTLISQYRHQENAVTRQTPESALERLNTESVASAGL